MGEQSPWLGLHGHDATTAMLRAAMSDRRLHHALLISGPLGIGKRTLARSIAAARLCPTAPMQGCGRCNSCLRVLGGTHSDHVQVQATGPGGRITRAAVQEAALNLSQAPHEGQAHTSVFAPADRMSPEAANALLKTLEEPRPGVMLILISERPDAVLSTLKSRSLHLPLRALTQAQTLAVLSDQGQDLSDPELQSRLELCPGQPGRVLALAKDPSLAKAERYVQSLADMVERPDAAAEIFASPQSALWSAWDDLCQVCGQEPPPDPEPDPVQKISGKKKTGKKKASRKKKSSASSSKKPSAAAQRKALRSLSEVWLAKLRAQIRVDTNLESQRQSLRRAQTLLALSDQIDRNLNPRLLLEQSLLAMLPAASPQP